MIVALTGGTGFVGRYVVEHLLRREHELRVLVRDEAQAGWLKDRGGVTLVSGSLEDVGSLRRLVDGADAVIHLVGIILEVGNQTYERVHVQGTRAMLAVAAEAGVKKFAYMSALGARDVAGATPYHRTKAVAEDAVRTSGLPHVILRPSLIAAPGNEVLKTLVRMLRMSPIVPVIGSGLYQLQPVAAEDVAEAFAMAIEEPGISGTFDIAGPDLLTYHELLDQLETALGVNRQRVAVPVAIVRFSAYAGMVLPNLNPITPDQLQMLLEGNTTHHNAISATFHVTPRPFSEVARDVVLPYASGHATGEHPVVARNA